MQKKGQAEVWEITLLFELVAGFVIAGVLLYAVLTLNDTSTFNTAYAEKDLELLKLTLASVPGETDVDFPLQGYAFENGKLVPTGTPLQQTTRVLSFSSTDGRFLSPVTKESAARSP